MSISEITIDQLRRMENQEGLVLQGCGGPLQDWLDGINSMLTQVGILKDGSLDFSTRFNITACAVR